MTTQFWIGKIVGSISKKKTLSANVLIPELFRIPRSMPTISQAAETGPLSRVDQEKGLERGSVCVDQTPNHKVSRDGSQRASNHLGVMN